MSHQHEMDFWEYFLNVYIDLIKRFSVKTVLRHYNKLHITSLIRWESQMEQINLYYLGQKDFLAKIKGE